MSFDPEALLAISIAVLAIGALLAIPAIFIARRWLRSAHRSQQVLVVTRAGLMFYALEVAILLMGYAVLYLRSGEASPTPWWAWLLWTTIVLAVEHPLGALLARMGHPPTRPRNDRIDGPPAA
jgi:hypothetical protein